MKILGISCFYHDSAAALIQDGQILGAAQEERFTRLKHDPRFPHQAIQFCLRQSGFHPDEIDAIVFYEKPLIKFERLLETYLKFAPRGFRSFKTAIPLWIKEKLFQKDLLLQELVKNGFAKKGLSAKIFFTEHHESHAASAYYCSPFQKAICLTMDGVGEWTTTSVYLGEGSRLTKVKELHFPHSLGLLYSAFTSYCGFKVNSGEYKLMGLAPYGKPVYVDLIKKHLIDIKADGSFALDMEYFHYCVGLTMTNARFHDLFGGPPRASESPLEQRHMDLAASIQSVLEEVVLRLCRSLRDEYQIENLCLAGGVALNCVANGQILSHQLFQDLWIQPAAGDAGGALGAALSLHYNHDQHPLREDKEKQLNGGYLGPEYSDEEIHSQLQKAGAVFEKVSDDQLIHETVEALVAEKAVGWHQGRMEFGPRALGSRSILADPRSSQMQKNLNLKVKFRESFRPFAPSVLREEVQNWFELDVDSPYMLLVAPVKKSRQHPMTEEQENLFGIEKLNISRSEIPAVTHIDYSARIQTVHPETNPRYHRLLKSFQARTGYPVVVNTSFNVRGEPIVCTPLDSFRCFMGSDIDFLAIGNYILRKENQNPDLLQDYRDQFELD